MKIIMRGLCGAALLVAIGAALSSQNIVNSAVSKPRAFVNSFQLTPQVMPSSLTDIATLVGGPTASHDVYLCWIDVTTKGSAGVVTIQDKQGTPVPLAYQLTIAANSTYSPFVKGDAAQTCRWFPGGVSVVAASPNTVWMYMSGYWQ